MLDVISQFMLTALLFVDYRSYLWNHDVKPGFSLQYDRKNDKMRSKHYLNSNKTFILISGFGLSVC